MSFKTEAKALVRELEALGYGHINHTHMLTALAKAKGYKSYNAYQAAQAPKTPAAPSVAAPIDPRRAVLDEIRAYLEQDSVWPRTQRNRSSVYIGGFNTFGKVSLMLEKHTCLFLLRIFEAAGITGWRIVEGGIAVDKKDCAHFWLEHADGAVIDLTADQHDLASVIFEPVAPTTHFSSGPGKGKCSGTKNVVLQWEGVNTGTWFNESLIKPLEPQYRRLVGRVRDAFKQLPSSTNSSTFTPVADKEGPFDLTVNGEFYDSFSQFSHACDVAKICVEEKDDAKVAYVYSASTGLVAGYVGEHCRFRLYTAEIDPSPNPNVPLKDWFTEDEEFCFGDRGSFETEFLALAETVLGRDDCNMVVGYRVFETVDSRIIGNRVPLEVAYHIQAGKLAYVNPALTDVIRTKLQALSL